MNVELGSASKVETEAGNALSATTAGCVATGTLEAVAEIVVTGAIPLDLAGEAAATGPRAEKPRTIS